MGIDPKDLMILIIAALITGGIACWKPHWILGLFMSTTIVKGMLRAYFPFLVSYTYDMAIAGLAFVAVLANYLQTRNIPRLLWNKTLFICYGIMVALTLLLYPLTRAPEAAFKNILMFGVYVCISLLIPSLFLRTEQNVRQLVRVMLVIGLIASIGTVFFPSQMYGAEYYGRETFLHSNPLAPSDAAAIACIVVLAFWLIGKRVRWIVLMPLFVTCIVASGSRGAIFGLGACVLLFLFISRNKAVLQALLFGPIVYVLLNFGIGFVQEQIRGRFDTESMGMGLQDRVIMVQIIISGWLSNNPIIGGGPGDSAYVLTGENIYAYPHNSLVEALCDLGPLGFTCLAIIYWKVLHRILLLHRWQWGQSPLFVQISIIGGAALYYLFLTLKTGSFYSAFLTWFYFSAFLHCYLRFSPESYWEDIGSVQTESPSADFALFPGIPD